MSTSNESLHWRRNETASTTRMKQRSTYDEIVNWILRVDIDDGSPAGSVRRSRNGQAARAIVGEFIVMSPIAAKRSIERILRDSTLFRRRTPSRLMQFGGFCRGLAGFCRKNVRIHRGCGAWLTLKVQVSCHCIRVFSDAVSSSFGF